MPRPSPNKQTAEQLKARIHQLLSGSQLRSLIPIIEETITSVAGTADPSAMRGVQALSKLVDYYERVFANGFGPRFDIDAWLAQDVCTRWSTPTSMLPQQIIPLYGEHWGYSLLPFPWVANSSERIYVVCFPGRSEIVDLNLLDYPWLCHELGHHLLSQAGAPFVESFRQYLEEFTKTLLRKATADSPNLRAKTIRLVQKLKDLWTPRTNTRDWAHEMAADAIALWTSGPAFLGAMQHVLQNDNIQPYEISETHPPYELRLRVLLELAENLQWGGYCSELKKILKQWHAEDNFPDCNEYPLITDNVLAEECLSHIVRACRSLNLPLCTPEQLRQIQQTISTGQDPATAIDYMLAAWLVYQSNANASQEWEPKALARLARELNGDP